MGDKTQPPRGSGILTFIGWRTNEDGREEFSAILVFKHGQPDLSLALATQETPVQIIPVAQIHSLEACKAALDDLLCHYVSLVESGDAGNWNAEKENEVIAARAALKGATP